MYQVSIVYPDGRESVIGKFDSVKEADKMFFWAEKDCLRNFLTSRKFDEFPNVERTKLVFGPSAKSLHFYIRYQSDFYEPYPNGRFICTVRLCKFSRS